MPAIPVAPTHRALSAGALLVLGGGLALYQLTSLVLGPASGREFQLSLTIPASDVDASSLALAEPANLVLGALAVSPSRPHRAAGPLAARPTVAPGPTPPPTIAPAWSARPVESAFPPSHHSDKPKPRHGD